MKINQTVSKRFLPFGMHKLVSLGFVLLMTSCNETILHDLDESQANKVTVALAQAGIEAKKRVTPSGWEVDVDDTEATAALKAIEQKRIFRPDALKNLKFSSSLLPNREERAHQLKRQLAASLEETLERLPHILEARVHLGSSFEGRLSIIPQHKQRSASVLVITNDERSVESGSIKKLVSGATGVTEKAVAVVVASTNSASVATAPEPKAMALSNENSDTHAKGSISDTLWKPFDNLREGLRKFPLSSALLLVFLGALLFAIKLLKSKLRRQKTMEVTSASISQSLNDDDMFDDETSLNALDAEGRKAKIHDAWKVY